MGDKIPGEEEQEEEVQRLLLSALDCEGVAPLRCATSPESFYKICSRKKHMTWFGT